MTYNVFSGTLNPTQSISCTVMDSLSYREKLHQQHPTVWHRTQTGYSYKQQNTWKT